MARRKNWLPTRIIALMRLHYQQGNPITELARVYKVHPSVVVNICHGRTHRRVVPASPDGSPTLYDVARRIGVSEQPPQSGSRRRLSIRQVAQIRAHYSEGPTYLGAGRSIRSPSERSRKHLSRTDSPTSDGSRGAGDSPNATEAVYAVECRCCWQADQNAR